MAPGEPRSTPTRWHRHDRASLSAAREDVRRLTIHAGKWKRELDYVLRKGLWAFGDDRIAVPFQYEWHDGDSNWFRSYGNELWEFDA